MLTCYLIGEDYLILRCGELLIKAGYKILGVIAPSPEIHEWCINNGITHYFSLKTAKSDLLSQDIDYLFSAVNSKILPREILAHVKVLAINYHNALLPQYAGVNANHWAILNNEKYHGVTWHTMEDIIDGGDILKQAKFSINHDETALSLNLKCYQYALDLFEGLIDELKQSNVSKKAQDFSQRTYHSGMEKPAGNGWIDWNKSATEIERTLRAFDLESFLNRFSTLKIIIDKSAYIISGITVLNEKNNSEPGTFLSFERRGWKIATATSPICINKICSIDGLPLSLKSVARKHNLKNGYKLNSTPSTLKEDFQKLSQEYFPFEQHWVGKLTLERTALPFLSSHCSQVVNTNFEMLHSIDIMKKFFQKTFDTPLSLITLCVIYLFRLGNREINLALGYPKLQCNEKINAFISPTLPVQFQLTNTMNFESTFKLVKDVYERELEKGSYLKDVYFRHPKLKDYPSSFPIGIIFTTRDDLDLTAVNCDFLFLINTTKNCISLLLRKESQLLRNKDLFSFIDNIPNHLLTLAESISNNSIGPIGNLEMMTEKEKETILVEWNKTETNFPADLTIAELFKQQVKSFKDAIAVKDGEIILTYSKLDELSSQLANLLVKKGLHRGDLTLLCGDSSHRLIISMLAILKVGSAYVPVDPQLLPHKVEEMLKDCQPKLILISKQSENILTKIKSFGKAKILIVEDSLTESSYEEKSFFNGKHSSEDIAYIMYTSGTTGAPKGVTIPNYAVNRLVKQTNYIKIKRTDRIAQAASISFDASTFEIWGALLTGASLICVSRAQVLNPLDFSYFLEREKITILWLTSELFNQLASLNPAMFKNLNYFLVGGDVINPEKVKLIQECTEGSPKCILNGYGPTENTTFTTTFAITKKAVKEPRIPIGKPISNTKVYVLDENLRSVPVGVPGELFTCGFGLAYGYLNKEELTEEKFIENPFQLRGGKLYRTGDIVRWLPDGNLDYFGRKDKQVKIRGFRVEIEAVQNQIVHYPPVSQCTVTIVDDEKLGKLLVAYIVPNENQKIVISQLQKFLHKCLPSFMIPNHFVFLEKLPLTENGKVNQQLLPKPTLLTTSDSKKYVKPKNDLEKEVTNLWVELLAIDKIGVKDSFFKLGGSSLMLAHLIIAIDKKFSYKLNIPAFLKEPTIANLTRLLSTQGGSQNNSSRELINSDTQLVSNLKFTKSTNSVKTGAVFLTGATGFLGAYLLHELAQNQKVFYLARSTKSLDVKTFVKEIHKKYGLMIPDNNLISVKGDLSLPYLGMNEKEFQHLGERIDRIYHNAANVHHIYSYELLRDANVLGTVELIKLASIKNIPLHYVSTLSAVIGNKDQTGKLKEEFLFDSHSYVDTDGYSQTKWVSERLLTDAKSRGLPVNIYRPAWILGQEKTGAVAANTNHLLLLIKGCLQMGYAPEWNAELNILSVDFVSKFIAKMEINGSHNGRVYNLSNPYTVNWVHLIHILINLGFKVQLVSDEVWREKLKSINESNALFQLLPLYHDTSDNWLSALDQISSAENDNTFEEIQKLGLTFTKIDDELISRYFKYLQTSKFL